MAAVVVGAGAVLMSSPPEGPGLRIGGLAGRLENQAGEPPLDFAAGQRDQPGRWGCDGVFAGGEDGEQGVGEHRQQRSASPGQPAAHLVLIQAGQALAALEGLLDGPAASDDGHQPGQPHRGAAQQR
jgi:hypothetical protein